MRTVTKITSAENFLAKGCFSNVKSKPLQTIILFFQLKDTSFAVGERSTTITFSLKDEGISTVIIIS